MLALRCATGFTTGVREINTIKFIQHASDLFQLCYESLEFQYTISSNRSKDRDHCPSFSNSPSLPLKINSFPVSLLVRYSSTMDHRVHRVHF